MTRTFYRVCLSDPPTRIDFVPASVLKPGRRAPQNPALRDLWEFGVSVLATEDAARRKALGWAPEFPLGEYIACLAIPDGSSVTAQKTLGPGHYTLRGDPEAMLSSVVSTAHV